MVDIVRLIDELTVIIAADARRLTLNFRHLVRWSVCLPPLVILHATFDCATTRCHLSPL